MTALIKAFVHGAAVLAAATLLLLPRPALAQDLEALSVLLTPAYRAMNLAAVCAKVPGWREAQPRGGRGTAIQYAEHVKNEIIEMLSYEDAVTVLKGAADVARADSLWQIRKLAAAGPTEGYDARVRAWCFETVRPWIAAFIASHDRDHVAFERAMNSAKSEKRI